MIFLAFFLVTCHLLGNAAPDGVTDFQIIVAQFCDLD
jgi:hypothetical protein